MDTLRWLWQYNKIGHFGLGLEEKSFYSPLEEMNPLISLKHDKSKRGEGKKGWISRHILSYTKNSVSHCYGTTQYLYQIHTYILYDCIDACVLPFALVMHYPFYQERPQSSSRGGKKGSLNENVLNWSSSVWELATLHGWGSTPYVSSIWAFWRKFSSDVSGVWPLRESTNKYGINVWLRYLTSIQPGLWNEQVKVKRLNNINSDKTLPLTQRIDHQTELADAE